LRARQGFRRAYQTGAQPWPANETCKWIVERLSASIDQELQAGERARIDAHLPGCPTCQFAARELGATKRLYGLMPLVSVPVGAQLTALMTAGGGVIIAFGAAKFGFGTAAAMVGSAVMLLMGSDGMSALGSVEAVLAPAAPGARTAVAVLSATAQPVAEVSVGGAAARGDAADFASADPPRPPAEEDAPGSLGGPDHPAKAEPDQSLEVHDGDHPGGEFRPLS
jgi:hypothetical protein